MPAISRKKLFKCTWKNTILTSFDFQLKTKFMVFHPTQKDITGLVPTLEINGIEIERVSEFKNLGVIIDENLSWKSQTNILSNKMSQYAGILNKIKKYLPLYVMRSLSFSMVGSALNYGLLTWGFICSRLTKIQKRVIRTITCSKYNAHTEPLLKALYILKIEDTLKLNTLKFYYKYTHDTLPSYFYTYNIETQGAHHSHDTRQQNQLRTNLTRTKYADNTLRNHLPVLVNDTPLHIFQKITTNSIYGFSSSVKQYYLNIYRIDCSIPNCYVCHR